MPSDFNGDGRDDILWINYQTDQLSNWLGTQTGGFTVNDANAMMAVPGAGYWTHTGSADSGIHPVTIGDFDGDGRSDVVLRDFDLLSMVLGTTSGGFAANASYEFPVVPVQWFVIGAGDFNADGRGDLLWRHLFGGIDIWLSTPGGGFVEQAPSAAYQVDIGWWVSATGDFNGDGVDDILWRNDNGALSNWLGVGDGSFTVNDANALTQVPTDWRVAGVGDFDGDGFDDILWRNDNGAVSNWLGAAGGGFLINDAFAFSQVSTEWLIAGVGDFNGDGFSDIFWRSTSGAVSNWLGSETGGFVINDANALVQVSTAWVPNELPASWWDNGLLAGW